MLVLHLAIVLVLHESSVSCELLQPARPVGRIHHLKAGLQVIERGDPWRYGKRRVRGGCVGFLLLCLPLRGGAAGARPTELHAAASHGSIYDVEGIIEGGAIVDELDASGLSALHLAIHAGRLGVAALLVAKGADVNQGDTSQRTPLHHAAARGLKGALIVLIDLGASLTASDERGWTPLHEAAAAYQVPFDGPLFSTFLFRSFFVPFVQLFDCVCTRRVRT